MSSGGTDTPNYIVTVVGHHDSPFRVYDPTIGALAAAMVRRHVRAGTDDPYTMRTEIEVARIGADGTPEPAHYCEGVSIHDDLAEARQRAMAEEREDAEKERRRIEALSPIAEPPQQADTRPGHYYVSATDGGTHWFPMAGPFATHQESLDLVDDLRDLVDMPTIRGWPIPPLVSINWTELAIFAGEGVIRLHPLEKQSHADIPFIRSRFWNRLASLAEIGLERPLIPNMHVTIDQILDIRIALEKPDEFLDDTAHKHLLGGHERESESQVKAHLIAENAFRPGTGPISLHCSVFHDMTQQVEILFHSITPSKERAEIIARVYFLWKLRCIFEATGFLSP